MTRWSSVRVVAALMCLSVVGGCASAPIPRADWGAITPDETLRLVTTGGARYDVSEVVVFEDAVEGTTAGGFALVRVPLDSVARLAPHDQSAFRVIGGAAFVAAVLGIVQAFSKGDLRTER